MPRKVFRAGNSLVISIPKEAAEQLRIREGSEVEIEIDREKRRLVVTLVGLVYKGVDEEYVQQVNEFIEQYGSALKDLAEGR